jgi:hypothetical protein
MLDGLFSIFKNGAIHRTALVTGIASNVVKAFEQEFAQDGNAKDAAIDALIYLLQQHKNSAAAPAQVASQPAAPAK